MQEPTNQKLLEVAIEAARTGGNHARSNSHRRSDVIQNYAHDVKLALDVECQTKVEEVLRRHFPEHAILGEEDETSVDGVALGDTKSADSSNPYEWIVDPIDGTVNFSHGFPGWCCSIAVRRGAEVLAAAVFAPDMDALYTATADTPARCNGEPIMVSKREKLAESLVMTGIDKNLIPDASPLEYFTKISFACQKTRVMGSAALDLCWVAQGWADGYFEGSIYIWDVAAAGLIVRQAGGRGEVVGVYDDPPHRMSYIASNGIVHAELKNLIGLKNLPS
jgi:myo-inositol-1(or 4)-monophosphatase